MIYIRHEILLGWYNHIRRTGQVARMKSNVVRMLMEKL